MSTMQLIIGLVVGYIFGNIPNGYLYAKSQGVDIYNAGSKNPGSTNVLRTLGKRAGVTVLLLDIAKTIVPIFFVSLYFKPATVDATTMLTVFTGLGAILGHDFPIIPGLRGGKGVACTGALIIAFDWRLAILLFSIFVLIVLVTRYVSLASIIGVSLFFVICLLLGHSGMLPMDGEIYVPVCVMTFLVAVLCAFQHRANIKRLLSGTENKFGSSKK